VLVGFTFASLVRAKDKPNEGTWRLVDDIDFEVTLDPWPATQGGEVTIHAIAQGDPDTKFSGTVEYRIATTQNNDGPWTAMKQAAAKDKTDVAFEVKAMLLKAANVFVQFKIKETGQEKPMELADWAIDLEQ
jgi:hypothetical protein